MLNDGTPTAREPIPSVPHIELVAGSVAKVCQLTGEYDRQRRTFARNRTESRFGVVGTDLGASFEHDGRLWFLFGDTWPDPQSGDSVAWTTDRDPEPGIGLTFVSSRSRFVSPRVTTPDGRGVSTGAFEVPLDGFSANGHMYVFRSTEHYREHGREVMGRSVLTRAVDGDPTSLRWIYDFSVAHHGGKFVNVSCVVVDDAPDGLPFRGPALLAWGSGRYRASDAHLAAAPLTTVEDAGCRRFYAGSDPRSGRPQWSTDEGDARALFHQPEIGELSVTRNAPLGVWLLLYNGGSPRGITARVAHDPWGPWSRPLIVFDPDRSHLGYGAVMHVRNGPDGLSDPGREHEWGGEYGPYVIDRYTRALPHRRALVHFVLSTWNPYNVVQMRMVLHRTG